MAKVFAPSASKHDRWHAVHFASPNLGKNLVRKTAKTEDPSEGGGDGAAGAGAGGGGGAPTMTTTRKRRRPGRLRTRVFPACSQVPTSAGVKSSCV